MKMIFKFTSAWTQRHRLLVTLGIAAVFHILALSFSPRPDAAAAVQPIQLSLRRPEVAPEPPPPPQKRLPLALAPQAPEPTKAPAPTAEFTTPIEPAVELASAHAVSHEGSVAVSAGEGPSSGAAPVPVPVAPPAPVVGRGEGASFAFYRSLLSGRLGEVRRYPLQARRMHIEGVTTIVFRITRDGRLAAPPVIVGSSHPLLDQEALRMVQAAAPFPALPQGYDVVEFTLPIRFSLTS